MLVPTLGLVPSGSCLIHHSIDWCTSYFFAGGNMPKYHPLHFHMVFLILLITMNTVETHVTDTSFDMVELGQSIKGK